MGKRLGDPDDPLLVSVRSGAKFSMPGMMETVLNVGLNDESACTASPARPAATSASPGTPTAGSSRCSARPSATCPATSSSTRSTRPRRRKGTTNDLDLDADDLRGLVDAYKKIFAKHTGRDFPQDPREQLDLAIRAVFDSWNADRAVLYRRQERIPADLGTAVNVVAMVFGNLGRRLRHRRRLHPRPGHRRRRASTATTWPTPRARTSSPASATPCRWRSWSSSTSQSYDELMGIMATLEEHYRDLCDIEFTIERGKLWMLQTRVGKRTAAAAFTIAGQLVDEGVIDLDEALQPGHRRPARRS